MPWKSLPNLWFSIISVFAWTYSSYHNFSVTRVIYKSNHKIIYFSAFPTYLNIVQDMDMPPSQHGYCTIQVFMLWSSLLCSTYLLIAMTFEHFYSITRPHKAVSFNTVIRAKIIIIGIFVFGFSYSSPYLFICTNIGRLCIPNRFASNNVLGEFYYWFSQIITFVFPFVSLLIMNSVIIHTLR